MHIQDLSSWTHDHRFDAGSKAAERGTRAMWITAARMVVEIAAGCRQLHGPARRRLAGESGKESRALVFAARLRQS